MAGARDAAEKLAGARALLARLAHLAAGNDPAVRRRLIEGLVSSIVVTSEPAGVTRSGRPKRRPVVDVTYCFADPAAPSDPHGPRDMMSSRAL
jgi:hypothetical protein